MKLTQIAQATLTGILASILIASGAFASREEFPETCAPCPSGGGTCCTGGGWVSTVRSFFC